MPLGFLLPHPGGRVEISPAFQRRDDGRRAPSPAGTAGIEGVSRPSGTYPSRTSNPALNRRAIIVSPSGTKTALVTSNPCGIGRPRPQRGALVNLLRAWDGAARGHCAPDRVWLL